MNNHLEIPEQPRKLRIAILWTNLTHYAHAYFSKLAARSDVDLWVGSLGDPLYNNRELFPDKNGLRLRVEVFEGTEKNWDSSDILGKIEEFNPDVYIGCGWNPKIPKEVARRLRKKSVRTVCCADTPWLGMRWCKQRNPSWLRSLRISSI